MGSARKKGSRKQGVMTNDECLMTNSERLRERREVRNPRVETGPIKANPTNAYQVGCLESERFQRTMLYN
jgi:hypothetical protein